MSVSHGSVAKKVRLEKEAHPERFCKVCLFRLRNGFCPRHEAPNSARVLQQKQFDRLTMAMMDRFAAGYLKFDTPLDQKELEQRWSIYVCEIKADLLMVQRRGQD